MQSFLDTVLDALPDWDTHPNSYCYILPSKRAGYFLRNRMAEKARAPLIAPEILSTEDFVERIAGISYAPSIDLLFHLYEAYTSTPGERKESFHDFSQWAQVLLQDFNEIDRYLVDSAALFDTLAALNEVKNWSLGEETTPMIRRQIEFWESLPALYQALRQKLLDMGLGYQGMVYRKAAAEVGAYLEARPDCTFVFIGFNALNTAEQTILNHLLEAGRARIFWDADSHYVNDPIHDAGYFLRRHRREWKALEGVLEGMGEHLELPKSIKLVGLPKSVSQAKYCGELLDRLSREGTYDGSRTAVILSDESLLQSVLHSLPETVNGANVTMGQPIGQSPFAQLFSLLFEWVTDPAFPRGPTGKILDILAHPYLRSWFESMGCQPDAARANLIRENALFCDRESLLEHGLPDSALRLLLPDPADVLPLPLTRHFLRLIDSLRSVYAKNKQYLALEYLHRIHALFAQLETLGTTYSFLSDVRGLYSLYQQLVRDQKIDFQGEPLEGVQIMGMLESRNLDFETVILTSVNEGILPAGKTPSSFIPFDVKRQYGMPTYKEKDAVYTYHFYRLLQRARRVYVLYNTEPQVLEGGEPSRFIHQLRTDPVLSRHVTREIAAPVSIGQPSPPPDIPKSEALLQKLVALGERGFSPTAIASLIEDPLRFYRKNILRLPDPDTLEETVAANTFGTVLHQALEDLYRPEVGKVLSPDALKRMKAASAGTVSAAFRKHYLKTARIEGRNLIALEVLKQYALRFLDAELQNVAGHEIVLLGVEEKFRVPFAVPGLAFPLYLKGTVDRIERVDGHLRIIDYKTGKVIPSQLRIDSWEALSEGPDKAKALQLLCYAWMYSEGSGELPLQAGILSFKNLAQGRQWFGYKLGGRDIREQIGREDLEAFRNILQNLFLQLFDPEIPLVSAAPTS